MAPPHFTTSQRFNARIGDQLEASVAFGLFMEAERIWAEREEDPSDLKYRNYHQVLTEFDIDRWAENARIVLSRFGSQAVTARRAEILQESLQRYETAARTGHRGFRWYGVLEAAIGTLVWTLTLIIGSLVIRYGTIDPIEIYHKVAGH